MPVSVHNGSSSIYKFLIMINHPKKGITSPNLRFHWGVSGKNAHKVQRNLRLHRECLVKGQVKACVWDTMEQSQREPNDSRKKITLTTLFFWKGSPHSQISQKAIC